MITLRKVLYPHIMHTYLHISHILLFGIYSCITAHFILLLKKFNVSDLQNTQWLCKVLPFSGICVQLINSWRKEINDLLLTQSMCNWNILWHNGLSIMYTCGQAKLTFTCNYNMWWAQSTRHLNVISCFEMVAITKASSSFSIYLNAISFNCCWYS